jgi:hypothetical protein
MGQSKGVLREFHEFERSHRPLTRIFPATGIRRHTISRVPACGTASVSPGPSHNTELPPHTNPQPPESAAPLLPPWPVAAPPGNDLGNPRNRCVGTAHPNRCFRGQFPAAGRTKCTHPSPHKTDRGHCPVLVQNAAELIHPGSYFARLTPVPRPNFPG